MIYCRLWVHTECAKCNKCIFQTLYLNLCITNFYIPQHVVCLLHQLGCPQLSPSHNFLFIYAMCAMLISIIQARKHTVFHTILSFQTGQKVMLYAVMRKTSKRTLIWWIVVSPCNAMSAHCGSNKLKYSRCQTVLRSVCHSSWCWLLVEMCRP